MKLEWIKIKSTVPNLHVAFNEDGEPMGMVDRPTNTNHIKNFWRCYYGVGAEARFLGHAVSKKEAQNYVHWTVELSNATVAVVG